ncbi:MAG: hypothetical protein ACK5YR_03565 [Pirellula sp.]|jgi:hypothetical protein
METGFSTDTFFRYSGQSLYEYFSAVIDNSEGVLPLEAQKLMQRLDDADEEHLVYGIEICSRFGLIKDFRRFVKYLTDCKLSVFCAMQRALMNAELRSVEPALPEIRTAMQNLSQPNLQAIEETIRHLEQKSLLP